MLRDLKVAVVWSMNKNESRAVLVVANMESSSLTGPCNCSLC